MIRVLLVNDLPPGSGSGAEVYLDRLAGGLGRAGVDVELFAGEVSHRGLARVLDVWDPRARRVLMRRAARFEPDVIHFHNVLNELSPSVLTVSERPTVLTIHDSRILGSRTGAGAVGSRSPLERARGIKDRLARAVARRWIDVVVAWSEYHAGRLREVGFRSVAVVPQFAEAGPDTGPPSGEDVLYAGQLSPEKGVSLLIDAFARLGERHPSSRLVIAGDGPQRAALEAHARHLVPSRSLFTGVVTHDEVRALMTRARLVCDPAMTADGSGLAIVEAALCGRPVIAADGPAQRELLADGALGVLVPAGDVAALADALDRLLGDPDVAQRLGAAARAAATERTVEAAVGRHLAVYERAGVIHGSRARS